MVVTTIRHALLKKRSKSKDKQEKLGNAMRLIVCLLHLHLIVLDGCAGYINKGLSEYSKAFNGSIGAIHNVW